MAASQIAIPRHHPAEEELVAHAAGQLDASRRVLLDGHLAYCGACREAWSSFAAPGGRLLGEASETAPSPHLLDSLLARVRTERQAPDPYAGLPLPREVLAVLPRSDALHPPPSGGAPSGPRGPDGTLAWDSPDNWTESSRVACLMADKLAEARLFLLQVPGGERIPRHQHLGHEHVLCLSGACSDEHTRLEPGDYWHYDPGSEHSPIMDPGGPCWIAVRMEKGARYT